jgi:ketose-bisphosphate aldolase
MPYTSQIIRSAYEKHILVPAFNIPYLPMMQPVIEAIKATRCFALIQVARLEWEKFEAGSLEAVREEYERFKDEQYMRLHLDHTPVIDEDGERVNFLDIIQEAITLGYQSVMVDGSRLPFEENVKATKSVVDLAHVASIPVEGELGAVLGHEAGPLPPYEELFKSKKGFTDPEDAERFVSLTHVDWVSVSIGNIHGSIALTSRGKNETPTARIDIEHLAKISKKARVPLVLHGGSGIDVDNILQAAQCGITKINIGTAIRVPYEMAIKTDRLKALELVYEATKNEIDKLKIAGSAEKIFSTL